MTTDSNPQAPASPKPRAKTPPVLVVTFSIKEFWDYFINLPECKLIKASGTAIYKEQKYMYVFSASDLAIYKPASVLVVGEGFWRPDFQDIFDHAKALGLPILGAGDKIVDTITGF
jgi:hypothetical protein